MNILGPVISEIRQNKNMSLEELSEGIVSKGYLSKLERGNSNFSANILLKLIDRLNLSFYELNFFYTKLQLNNQPDFLNKFKNALTSDDTNVLKRLLNDENKLLEISNNIRHTHNMILLKQMIRQLEKKPYDKLDTQIISDYLASVSNWNYYETTLFTNATFFLPTKLLIFIGKSIYSKTEKFLSGQKNKQETALLITNLVLNLLERNELDDIPLIISAFENFVYDARFYFPITKMNYIKGLYYIKTDRIDFGKKLISDALSIMEYMNNYSVANAHKIYYEKFLSNL